MGFINPTFSSKAALALALKRGRKVYHLGKKKDGEAFIEGRTWACKVILKDGFVQSIERLGGEGKGKRTRHKGGPVMYAIAKLTEDQIQAVRKLEAEDHVQVVALADLRLAPADLPPTTLDHLRELEEKLGICLVAVQ